MSERPLSVLFLTRYPEEGASSRYRVFQYIPYLEKLGVTCHVQSFMDQSMYRASMSEGATGRKMLMTVSAAIRRLRTLLKHRRYDVVYMQRELLPFGPPLIESALKRSGTVLVFDYDDALFIKQPSRYNPLATLFRSPEKTIEILRLVDCTVAGNDWLRDSAVKVGGRAETIEVAEDTARFAGPEEKFGEDRGPVTIGWLGSPSTSKYLNEIADVLREVASAHPEVRFEIMGGGEFAMDGVPWRLESWSLEAEREALKRYDIGLMPLPDQDWSRGKSGGKARTYMASTVVPVVSAIGYNNELLRHGETGFLCKTKDDWRKALEKLISDKALREKMARAARKDVEERFDPAGQAAKIAALLRHLVDEKVAA